MQTDGLMRMPNQASAGLGDLDNFLLRADRSYVASDIPHTFCFCGPGNNGHYGLAFFGLEIEIRG